MVVQPFLRATSVLVIFCTPLDDQVTSCFGTHKEAPPGQIGPHLFPKLTNQFVLLDEAAKLPTRNQLAPLSQDQLRGEDHMAHEEI